MRSSSGNESEHSEFTAKEYICYQEKGEINPDQLQSSSFTVIPLPLLKPVANIFLRTRFIENAIAF